MQYAQLPAITRPDLRGYANPSARQTARKRKHDNFNLDTGQAGTFIGWSPQAYEATMQLFVSVSGEPEEDRYLPTDDPNRNIRRAVLADALRCLKGTATLSCDSSGNRINAKKRERQRAYAWLIAEDHDWPFSCVNICFALGVNHQCLIALVERYREGIRDD